MACFFLAPDQYQWQHPFLQCAPSKHHIQVFALGFEDCTKEFLIRHPHIKGNQYPLPPTALLTGKKCGRVSDFLTITLYIYIYLLKVIRLWNILKDNNFECQLCISYLDRLLVIYACSIAGFIAFVELCHLALKHG